MRKQICSLSILLFIVFMSVNGYAYTPPIGIPDPGWGIDEVKPTRPSLWTSDIAGYYYVSYTTGTDTGRIYGNPTAPRKTIPNPIKKGSYIEISGTYNYVVGSYVAMYGATDTTAPNGNTWSAGTDGPAWIVGKDANAQIVGTTNKIYIKGTYIYVDGLTVTDKTFQIGSITAGTPLTHHIMVRNCTVTGSLSATKQGFSFLGNTTAPNHDCIIYNNIVHDMGDITSQTDTGACGIMLGNYLYNVWVLNNTVYNIAGAGIHMAGQSGIDPTLQHHLYAGFNHVYNNMETGIGTKTSTDVIISQNHIHNGIDGPWSPAKALAAQYSHNRTWFLYNIVHAERYGIFLPSVNTTDDTKTYVIGNLIYDTGPQYRCTYEGCATAVYGGTSAYDEAAITSWGPSHLYIINNTLYDNSSGIHIAQTGVEKVIENNIVSGISQAAGQQIWVYSGTSNTIVRNNDLYQSSGTWRIKWGTAEYKSLLSFQNATGKGESCRTSDPLFLNAANYADLSIQYGSPAIDTALASSNLTDDVYAVFYANYGINIKKDLLGVARPQGYGWDMGAYEYNEGGNTMPPPVDPPPAPLSPVAPGNLTATGTSTSQINLKWTDNATNEEGFKVERCVDSACSNFALVATLTTNTTSYTNTGLAGNTTYYYRVRAYNASGNSAYSNIAGGRTLSSATTPAATLPAAPAYLKSSAISTSQVYLSWSDKSSNETGFKIERCTGNGCTNFAQIKAVGSNVKSYWNTGLSPNVTYTYRVRSYNTAGNSSYSNVSSAKTVSK